MYARIPEPKIQKVGAIEMYDTHTHTHINTHTQTHTYTHMLTQQSDQDQS